MLDGKKILIIGAHYDDPELGCGGLMAKYPKAEKLVLSEIFRFGAMNAIPMYEMADAIRTLLVTKQFNVVFTHYPKDWNSDHRAVGYATLIACRRLPIDVYFYEVLSSTEQALKSFNPNVYFPLNKKEVAIKIKSFASIDHPSTINSVRNEDNLMIWTQMRGIECGEKYAEAYILYRKKIVDESSRRYGGDHVPNKTFKGD